MPHVFVETNWLFAYAAPAHHQVSAAADLLDRAARGEFTLHLPNICLGEARQAIRTKCQPRNEANALRRFLSWATPAGSVTSEDAAIARTVLDKYERSIQQDLDNLDANLKALASLPCVDICGLDDTMLNVRPAWHSRASRQNHSTTPSSPASWSARNDSGTGGNEDYPFVKRTPASNLGDNTATSSHNCATRTIKHTFGSTVTSR